MHEAGFADAPLAGHQHHLAGAYAHAPPELSQHRYFFGAAGELREPAVAARGKPSQMRRLADDPPSRDRPHPGEPERGKSAINEAAPGDPARRLVDNDPTALGGGPQASGEQ
jgi:hypothetical protein